MRKKNRLALWGQCALLLLAVILLLAVFLDRGETVESVPPKISFQGEYRIGSGEWKPLLPNERILLTNGCVTLRGRLYAVGSDGAAPEPLAQGTPVLFYLDHIGAEVFLNGESVRKFNTEDPRYGAGSCGEEWVRYNYDASQTDTWEIVLRNPHRYGNRTSVDEFLGSMLLDTGADAKTYLLVEGTPARSIGFAVLVFAIFILGAALFSAFLRVSEAGFLCQIGLTLFFSGGYLIFDSPNISVWSTSIIWNTTALQLCTMLYTFFLMCLIVRCLPEKRKRAGEIIVAVSGLVSGVLFILAVTKKLLFYDTRLCWAVTQAVCAVLLICCCIGSFKGSGKRRRLLLIFGIAALAALPADILATMHGWWQGALISLVMFLLLFLAALTFTLYIIPINHNAVLREKELENELQKSRVAIIRSQIQPHFLYNTIDSIYHLCEKNPQQAQQTLRDFSEYLRMNLTSLERKAPIPFEAELKHIQTYLALEKMSSDDELNYVFDIETVAFSLPALSVQPLVENAVKHGVGKKAGGGTVTLRTREYADRYEVTVCDDGVGFDPPVTPEDERLHIGIENTRQRLSAICGGTLNITSRPGFGTTAVVTIPKGENET